MDFGVFTGALKMAEQCPWYQCKGQGAMPRKKIDKLVEFAKVTVQRVLLTLQSQKMAQYKSSLQIYDRGEMNALVQAMDGKPGDLLLFAADKNKIV